MYKNHKTKKSVASLLLQMSAGYAGLLYWTKDWRMREAVGTMNVDLIPVEHRPKGHTIEKPNRTPWIKKYYDFTVSDWRSYDRHRLICWYPLNKNDPEVADLINKANDEDEWDEALEQIHANAPTLYGEEQMEVELPEPEPTPTPTPGGN